MKNFVLSILFLFSVLSFGQTENPLYGIYPQGEGIVLEHDHCSLFVVPENVLTKSSGLRQKVYDVFDNDMKDILIKKGYQVINSPFKEFKKSSVKNGDLVLEIKSPLKNNEAHIGELQINTQGLYNLEKILVVSSEAYKRSGSKNSLYFNVARKSLKTLYNKIPNCRTQRSGNRLNDQNYSFEIRKHEIQSCINIYNSRLTSLKNEEKTGNTRFIVNLGAGVTAFAGYALIFPPLYGAGVGIWLFNSLVFNPSLQTQIKRVEDSLNTMRAIQKCESLKEIQGECDEIRINQITGLSGQGKRSLNRLTKKMSFSDFSERVANSLAIHKTCSKTNLTFKDVKIKKILKEAKNNF